MAETHLPNRWRMAASPIFLPYIVLPAYNGWDLISQPVDDSNICGASIVSQNRFIPDISHCNLPRVVRSVIDYFTILNLHHPQSTKMKLSATLAKDQPSIHVYQTCETKKPNLSPHISKGEEPTYIRNTSQRWGQPQWGRLPLRRPWRQQAMPPAVPWAAGGASWGRKLANS